MAYEEDGGRIRDLRGLLNATVEIYTLASDQGLSVRFLNGWRGRKNVRAENLEDVIKRCNYRGMTKIGAGLKRKILGSLLRGNMEKPLLVMVIIDGKVGPIYFRSLFPFPENL